MLKWSVQSRRASLVEEEKQVSPTWWEKPHLVDETSPGGRNPTWWEKPHLVGETSPGG